MSLESSLRENSYPGRGIVAGLSADGKYAVCAYFIMGRSVNSRNRVFVEVPEDNGIETRPFDITKLSDPSLIIYHPVRVDGHTTIVTNGDQTDTVRNGLDKGFTFEQSLRSRTTSPISTLCKRSSEKTKLIFFYPIIKKPKSTMEI